MTHFRTMQQWGFAVLVLGSLVFASTEGEAAPIKFNITDLGRVSGRGLDNDGNVIALPIRNIVGTLPSSYSTDPLGQSDYNEVIDGTADGRLLVNAFPFRARNLPGYAFVYNPNATGPGDVLEPPLGNGNDRYRSGSYAMDINSQGDIVGQAKWGGASGERPFFAASDSLHRLQDLNDLIPADSGWKLNSALSINDRGQILASGVNPEGVGSFALLTRADQVPEPATWAVFGLAAAFAYRRRRAG